MPRMSPSSVVDFTGSSCGSGKSSSRRKRTNEVRGVPGDGVPNETLSPGKLPCKWEKRRGEGRNSVERERGKEDREKAKKRRASRSSWACHVLTPVRPEIPFRLP